MRIIFMGTPDFAVKSLDILIQNNFDIVAVITAPDRPAGRGLKVHQSAIKKYALDKGLNILQPTNLKHQDFITALKELNADLQIVVAFRMLPEVVWSMPPLGTFNLHASLLPQYRGAAPINWAVINGEKETGVTTFFLKHEIDTGNIIGQKQVKIEDNETAGNLHDKLMDIGAELVLQTVKKIDNNTVTTLPQNEDQELKHAPKIFREDCKIDWNKQTDHVYNLIRGLSPYPVAWTKLDNKVFKIFSCIKENGKHNQTPGDINSDNKTFLKFVTTDGFINVKEVQLEGKRKMKIQEFLSGFKVT